MRCKPIFAGLVLSSIVFATVSAQAQVSIDFSKITCDEYVHDAIPTSDFISFSALGPLPFEARSMLSRWLIANWLSGYYHAKRNNWIIDSESFEDNVSKLTNYCWGLPLIIIISAAICPSVNPSVNASNACRS